MKKTIIAIILFALHLWLVSCNRLKEGYVVEKYIEPEREYMMLMPMQCGKTTVMIPMRVHDNEDYVVKIKGYYRGEYREESIYINPYRYDTLKSGQFFCVDNHCSREDDNNTRTRNHD